MAAVTGRNVTVHGAGRTDAGVHASGQVAHLDLPAGNVPSGETRRALVQGVNHHLPAAIRVLAADADDDSFHARRSASLKVYIYRLCTAPVIDPFRAPFVVPAPRELDLESMKTAASLITGRHDFSAFAKAGGSHRSPLRTIREAGWAEQGDEIRSGSPATGSFAAWSAPWWARCWRWAAAAGRRAIWRHCSRVVPAAPPDRTPLPAVCAWTA